MQRLLEVPFTSATAFDATLGGGKAAGAQKTRLLFARQLGPTRDLSLGRGGRVHLASAAVLPCLVTAVRWNRSIGKTLCDAYLEAGLGALVRSGEYRSVLGAVAEAIRSAAAPACAVSVPALVARTIERLVVTDASVRRVATKLTTISDRIDARFEQVRIFRGRVERIEKEDALLVVDSGKRERLRRTKTRNLANSGIQNPGDRFFLYELRWTPDTAAEVFVPAVRLEDATRAESSDDDALEARLRAAETPLPAAETSLPEPVEA